MRSGYTDRSEASMTCHRICAFAICIVPMLLAGCSSMSEKQCRAVNWAERGERDAYDGQSRERIASYQDACSEFGIQPDVGAYNAGYAKGIALYCTPQRGYAVGMKGTQTVFGGQPLAGRLRGTIQGYAKPDFDLPSLDADFVDDEA
jgi:hypothetical protein